MATTTDLGKWMITNGGDYDPEKTYEQLTMVMYDSSTYITLKQVTGVTPADDKLNYILMARGFNAAALNAVTATDTSGALGEEGASVNAQSLVDYLADAVMTKLLKKTDIATVLADATDKVPALSLVNELNNAVTQLNIQNIKGHISATNSGMTLMALIAVKMGKIAFIAGTIKYATVTTLKGMDVFEFDSAVTLAENTPLRATNAVTGRGYAIQTDASRNVIRFSAVATNDTYSVNQEINFSGWYPIK